MIFSPGCGRIVSGINFPQSARFESLVTPDIQHSQSVVRLLQIVFLNNFSFTPRFPFPSSSLSHSAYH